MISKYPVHNGINFRLFSMNCPAGAGWKPYLCTLKIPEKQYHGKI